MSAATMPVVFVSHGGGPWPYIDGMKEQFAHTARELRALPARLPAQARAVLVISGHWEAANFTLSTAARPPMEYDYFGFPEHTYHIKYAAPGAPQLAARVGELLDARGIAHDSDPARGFDHGTFVPLDLMYPAANVPVLMLSLKSNYDAAEHIRLGEALQPLRDEGVLIMGSGLTYHNMRGFRTAAATPVATAFEAYLNAAVANPDTAERHRMLIEWQSAPAARLAHPREDHLIPLMVAAGAAGAEPGRRLFTDHAMSVPMVTYGFGNLL